MTEQKSKKIKDLTSAGTKSFSTWRNRVTPRNDFIPFQREEIEQSIPARFKTIVEKYPDHIAVKTGPCSITYKALDQQANRVAQRILNAYNDTYALNENEKKRYDRQIKFHGCGIEAREKPQRAVALLFEHGPDMIPGILGVLKTGILYVPLDASYPVDRLFYILEDSDARVIVTNSENLQLADTLKNHVNKNISVINSNEIPAGVSQDDLNMAIDPGEPAYILYTSGSTGKPKGVMQNHRNVLHHARVYTNALHIHAQDRLTLFSSYSFDAAKMDIYGALLNGATLYPYNIKQENNLLQLPFWLKVEGITIYHSIPTVYRYFISLLEGKKIADFSRLRMIVLGGEAVYKQDVINYKKYFSDDCLFVNGLGPTESTVTLQYFIDKKTEITREAVPVGYPVEDTEVFLLTGQNQEAGVLGVGEIVFKSEHLAVGYWKNPELTAEKFMPSATGNPFEKGFPGPSQNFSLDKSFSGGAGGRFYKKAPLLYKTGDLGRRLPDGAIEFVGRSDFQVKINGYRVEPGEIESKLDQVTGIKKSVIVCKTGSNGENFLAAYYITSGEKDLNEKDLVSALKETLPDYMIPAVFLSLPGFPLTATGKIDRKLLSDQDFSHLLPRSERESPGSETEKHLLKLWQDVLKKDAIGVNENFFVLGGNSIKAILLVSLLHRELEVKISLVDIFKYPTIKDLAKYVEKMEKSQKSIYEAITPVEKKEIYLQSSAQRRLYFLAQFKETGTVYNMPSIRKLVEKPEIRKFERIFKHIIDRHETLRTSFEIVGNDPVQRIHDQVDFMIETYKAGTGETVDDILHRFVRPFDLAKAPLLRVGVVTLPGQEYYLVYDLHHIICDGTSITILYDEFTRLYKSAECDEFAERAESAEPVELKALYLQYKDFSDWQNRLLESDRVRTQEHYWLELYADAGDIPHLNLPFDYPRPPALSYEGDSFQFETGPVETAILQEMGSKSGATLYMCLLAILNILFYKYTGQEDIIIGVGIAGRAHAGLENIIGMFVNMLAMRNQPQGGKTWCEFLSEVKGNSLTAFENQDVQFEALVEKLALERDPAYSPLIDVMLVVQNFASYPRYPRTAQIESETSISTPLHSRHKTAKFDLGLLVRETDRGIDFELEYRTTLFKRETIARLAGHFLTILKQVGENPGIPAAAIEIISPEEKRQLLEEFNQVPPLEERFQSPQTIRRLFEERVRQFPDHRAVVDSPGNRVITYRHLNSKANKLGRLLREKGIGCDGIVAVMIDRSIALIEGILGILKGGGAYLPLDPTVPRERINAMINDSGTNLLISDNALSPGFNPGIEILNIQTESIFCRVEREVENNSSGHDLLYVVYTSGSTGKPKGIMLEHRNLLNLIRFQHHYTNIDFSRVLQFASIGFDVSFQEIFSTLLWGGAGTLYLIPNGIRTDITRLFRYVEKTKITTLFLPTSFFKFLFKEEQEGVNFPGGVKHIVVAGEQLVVSSRSRECLQRCHIYLHNHYGPAETHVVTTLTLAPGEDIPTLPAIGRPISGSTINILDKDGRVTPVGVPGELVIGGVQVGRGYLNNPELSAERFYRSYRTNRTYILYKTGDLARWPACGNIEFLGRIDQQIKLRGFRIEPGEIEERLMKHTGIKEAVVVPGADESGEKYLCAYIVPHDEDPGDEYAALSSELKSYLNGQLPDYMVPTYIIPLGRIPLTRNGKVDRRALPQPHTGKPAVEYSASLGRVEKTLRDIWAAVLNIQPQQVGATDNFFDLGGHSLRAAVMISKVHQQLKIEMPLSQVFKTPRIRDLAEYIKSAAPGRFFAVAPVEKQDYYPLASAQKRLYALQQIDPESIGYNMFKLFELVGKADPGLLENTFRALLKRHESLRTSFPLVAGVPVQKIHENVEFEIENVSKVFGGPGTFFQKGSWPPEAIIKSFIRPFDLSKAPLLRVGLMKVTEDRSLLMVDMHHIITDGVSHGILIRDFTRLYRGRPLPDLQIQYKEYSQWQNCLLESGELKKQEAYWLNEFRHGDIPVLELPTDFPRPARQNYEGVHTVFMLPGTLTRALRRLVKETNATLYIVLLAAYNVLLSRYSRGEDIVVGSPVTGRRHADLQDIIGIFVNMLAVRTKPMGYKTFAVFLHEVKEKVLAAVENQDYQFYELVARLGLHGQTGKNPLFSVVLAMQNIDLEGSGEEGEELIMVPREFDANISRFDLLFNVMELEESIRITVEYSTQLFKAATVEGLITHYREVLEQVTGNKDLQLNEIKISCAAAEIETAALLEEGNFNF